ncbi:MAG TPA: hypothetical protein VI078_15305 [bacterium]
MNVRRTGLVLALLALVTVSLCLPTAARAVGIGVGVDVKGGTLSLDEPDEDYDFKATGLNFVLDTNVAADRIFNYRLALGYERETVEDGQGNRDLKIDRMVMTNTFGFGVVRTAPFRLWIGPQISLAYGYDSDFNGDFQDFGIGIGPALGVNFNLGPVVTLGLEAGYEFSGYSWETDYDDGDGTRNGFRGAAVLLFRLDDNF